MSNRGTSSSTSNVTVEIIMDHQQQPTGFFLKIQQDQRELRVRLFCTTSDWSQDIHISQDERTLEMIGNQQLRLTTLDNSDYLYFSLLNKKVSYTVDVSHVKKNWNSAFYTCDFSHLRPPQYLDAQSWESRIEIDYQEASRTAYHYTAHRNGDRNGTMIMGIGGSVQSNPHQYFQRLDQVSQPVEQLYGPDQYINTKIPFHVAISHTHQSVRIELSQDGKIIWNETTNPEYIEQCRLSEPIHTFIFSLWTGYMSWLDGNLPWYNENGLDPVRVVFSNIAIDTLQ